MDGLGAIVDAMLGAIPTEALDGLEFETEDAIETFFEPVGVRALPASTGWTSSECACDGFYDTVIDPRRPWILYDDSVARSRQLFTLLHELGHHILWMIEPELIDELDQIAGARGDPIAVEEAACHRFAGELLVSADAITDAMGGASHVRPEHVVALQRATSASWECVAVRLAQRMDGQGVVVLMREPGIVSFCASSGGLVRRMWPRGSRVAPGGPLSRAFRVELTARDDVYRWDVAYSMRLFCDTLPVNDSLAIGVLASAPSDGSLALLAPDPEPKWRRTLEYCMRCADERIVGWCDACKGRKCRSCGTCGCFRRPAERLCPSCGFLKGPGVFREGNEQCRDCQ